MNKQYTEILNFLASESKVFLLHLYPSIDPKFDARIEAMIERYATSCYKEEVWLSRRGLVNCKQISYLKEGDWIGSCQNGYLGLRKHAKKSIRNKKLPTRVYVLKADRVSKMVALKAEIRELIGRGTWPCHITDTYEEALTLGRIYFNPNALLVYNGRNNYYDSGDFDAKVEELKRRLQKAGLPLEGIVGAGSTSLGAAGIRKANDFDYLALDERYDQVLNDDIYSPHDSQLCFYPLPKEEIITNSDYYFYYRGLKFISLDVLARMKSRRHNWPKDWRDYFRIKLFMVKAMLLKWLSAWRYVI